MSLPNFCATKGAFRHFKCLFSFIIITTFSMNAAHAQTLDLRVQNNQQTLIVGATIYINGTAVGSTNEQGFYHLSGLSEGSFELQASSLGYESFNKKVSLSTIPDPYIITLANNQTLGDVVVTAGRKVEYIDEIPSSVTILSKDEIQTQINISSNLATIIGNTVPGLGTSNNKMTNTGQTLRGRAVLVLIDGIPQSTPLMNGSRDIRTIDPGVIERIEVIKGATSIYGNGSGGGIINYITKKPDDHKSFSGETTIGTSINPIHANETLGYRLSQLLSGRANKFSYVVSGSVDYTGLQRDGKGAPIGQTDGIANSYQYNAFLKLMYDIDTNTAISAFYNLYSSTQHAKYINQTGEYGVKPSIGIPGEEPGEPAGTPYNHNLILSFTKRNLFGNTQLDLTGYFNSFSSMNRYVEQGTAWYGPGQTRINSEKKGIRLNLNTPFLVGRAPAEVTYGVDLLNDITNQNLNDGRVYIPDMNMINFAPYAQLKMDILQNLIFKGGIRYENATVTIKDFSTIATGPDGEGSRPVSGGKIPYNATMFNAGLRFTKFNLFNPFISFSQGFAINELGRIVRRATANTLEQLATDPIITNNYEVGFSSQYRWLNLSAAYYISTSRLGVNLIDVGGYLMPQREPENVRGFEIAAEAKLSPQWTIGGNYTYVEGKAELEDGTEVYLTGSRITPSKANAFVFFKPIKQLNLQLFWVHTSTRDRFDPNNSGSYNNSEGPVKAIDLFNVSAGYAINSQWSIGLGVENVLNKTYFPTASQYRGMDPEYVHGNGAQANLNLHFKF